MSALNLLVKPTSSNCNLRCSYCFYHDVANNRDISSFGLMSIETMEVIVKRAFEYADQSVNFIFQGGEPTLIGLEFYEKFIEFQKKYNRKKLKVSNSIQTNGILINQDWASFLRNNNFLVGLSMDGPKDINDRNRIDANNNGTFIDVERAARLFTKYNVQFNILSVVNKNVARHVEKVYSYFVKRGFRYLQFIPCLDNFNKKPGTDVFSLTVDDYELFLKKLFDLWYRDFKNGIRVSIRMFDNIMFMLSGYPPESCDMSGLCSVTPVIESDGSIYPCDFYVLDEWKIGNVLYDSCEEILCNDNSKKFVSVSHPIHGKCKDCKYFYLCRGGCRRHYEPIIDNDLDENYFCQAYKGFYAYSLDRFYEILNILK